MGRPAVCRVLAAAALVLPLLVEATVAPWAGPPAAAAPAAAPHATLALTSVTPTIVGPGDDLVVSGTLRNDDTAPLDRPVVRVVLGPGDTELDSDGVQAWAAQTGPAQGTEVARVQLKGAVVAGGSATFRVAVKGLASRRSATFGALPLSVESSGAAVRTFAGFQRVKQYQPVGVAWAVPLTIDPDPALFGAEGAAREGAWTQALGDGSRVDRVLAATEGAPVTWAVDPTLTPTLLGGDEGARPVGKQERSLRDAMQERITAGAPQHSPWVLADTDADLAAVPSTAQGQGLMRTLVGRAQPVAQALGGRADIAWPAGGGYSSSGEASLRRLFRVPALAAQVTAASALTGGLPAATPNAAQRSPSGLPLLTYDDALSELLAHTTSPGEAVLSGQRFIAESAALVNERPGTSDRTVLVVAPRSFNPDPAATRAFLDLAAAVPWLTPTTTEAELALARRAPPTSTAPVTRPRSQAFPVRPAVLTTARLRNLEQTVRTVTGVAQIRDDRDQFARTWTRAAEQLASTRWRDAPTGWLTLSGRVTKAAQDTTSAVKVAAGNINFLADSGRLQITVTNALDVPVENVKLTVAAANPRLRIDSPPSILRIGPRSRATVTLRVTALAAGLVPLQTTLTTPDGTVVGQGANVQVQVTPTGDWVYWALGGVAGAILLLGIWRSVRRRPDPEPAARPDAPAPPPRERTP